jgi:hypothetical protein
MPFMDARLVSQFRELVHRLDREVRSVDIRVYEVLEVSEHASQLRHITRRFLGEAVALAREIVTAYERSPDLLTNAEWLGPGIACDYRGTSFLAHLDLGQLEERFASLSRSADPVTLIVECDAALRAIHGALYAMSIALAHAEQALPAVTADPELERSLRLRRTYVTFREKIRVLGEPDANEVLHALRAVASALAGLVADEAYPDMRAQDRMQLRSLQRRIASWLGAETTDGAHGVTLFHEVQAFVETLRQVNWRQELVRHDIQVLRRAALFGQRPDRGREFPREIADALSQLGGLNAEVDRLLTAADLSRVDAWMPLLERFAKPNERS